MIVIERLWHNFRYKKIARERSILFNVRGITNIVLLRSLRFNSQRFITSSHIRRTANLTKFALDFNRATIKTEIEPEG